MLAHYCAPKNKPAIMVDIVLAVAIIVLATALVAAWLHDTEPRPRD